MAAEPKLILPVTRTFDLTLQDEKFHPITKETKAYNARMKQAELEKAETDAIRQKFIAAQEARNKNNYENTVLRVEAERQERLRKRREVNAKAEAEKEARKREAERVRQEKIEAEKAAKALAVKNRAESRAWLRPHVSGSGIYTASSKKKGGWFSSHGRKTSSGSKSSNPPQSKLAQDSLNFPTGGTARLPSNIQP